MPIRAKTRRPGFDETEILELDRPDDVTTDGADASERDGRTDHDREPDERISPLPYDATAFPDGVSSGDVTQNSAVLWARASSLGHPLRSEERRALRRGPSAIRAASHRERACHGRGTPHSALSARAGR
jgi:hypothetical protein